jgi:phosphatidylglycerophosphate synthase
MSLGFFAHDRLKRQGLRSVRSGSSFAGEHQAVVTALAKIRLRRPEEPRVTASLANFLRAIFVGVHPAPGRRDRDAFPRPSRNIIAPLFCYLRLWFNMLDGLVAFAAEKASRRGEILNDLPDRISDIVIFVGVAHSGLMNPLIGYWAAIFAVLTSYVGLFGQALGVQRQFGGIMSKPWRMVALHGGAWLTFFLPPPSSATLTIFDWTCLVIIAGCVETIVVRLKHITAALQDKR